MRKERLRIPGSKGQHERWFRRLHVDSAALLASSLRQCTYAIHKVKNDPHGHAELLKIEVTVIVDVCEIPDSGELILAQLAVLEDGSCLIST